jgi:hypothetical protein
MGIKNPNKAELMRLIDSLIGCNDPLVTSTMIGWFSACMIKVHLTNCEYPFPLLNLWGGRESGKSSMSNLFSCLHGRFYLKHGIFSMVEQPAMSLQGATPWAAAQYLSTSTSTARLLEQFDRSDMSDDIFDEFAGLFKAAWNQQDLYTGTIRNEPIQKIKISSPVCVMSEQIPDRPALRQRMVTLEITKSGRQRLDATENYSDVINKGYLLTHLSSSLLLCSLDTGSQWVKETMAFFNDFIPKDIQRRQQICYSTVLTGIMYFGRALQDIGLDQDYIDMKTNYMLGAVIDNLNELYPAD